MVLHEPHGHQVSRNYPGRDKMKHTENEVFRPWGSFRSLLLADNHQIKEIFVDPGQRLSLQSHQQRSEHWIITNGPALVTIDDQELKLEVGAHIFIPQGAKHRLTNPGEKRIKIVEIQIGNYLGEDDITRYEDAYQRDVKERIK